MLRIIVFALAGCLFLVACGGKSDSPASNTAGGGQTSASNSGGGNCGVRQENGVNTRTFCGNATAQMVVDGKTLTFDKGECEFRSDTVAVNVGTTVIGSDDAAKALKAKYAYFGAVIGQSSSGKDAASDGAYPGSLVTANDHGTGYTVGNATVTLKNNRKSGEFTGTKIGSQDTITGTFTC
jgi:hypothetical protein